MYHQGVCENEPFIHYKRAISPTLKTTVFTPKNHCEIALERVVEAAIKISKDLSLLKEHGCYNLPTDEIDTSVEISADIKFHVEETDTVDDVMSRYRLNKNALRPAEEQLRVVY